MTKSDSPIKGIGIDIIEVDRIEESIRRYGDRLLNRLFTEKEIAYCKQHVRQSRHFAGRFAAKESIAKALGCGIGQKLAWKDLEILNNEEGKPVVTLTPDASLHFKKPILSISISHCKAYASAVAIWT